MKRVAQNQNPGFFTSYVSYLKELYSSMSQSRTSQHWTHLPRCEFIQLAMIGSEPGIWRGDREEEMVRLAQQGRIETILDYKQPIDFDNLFPIPCQPLVVLPPPPRPRVLLIEGAPGGGKSTFVLYFCQRWASQNSSFLAKFDLVILVYLREEAIQNATTLAKILPANSMKLSQEVATQIVDTHGRNVLFVFDGWDEFPSHLQKNSLISTIIRQPHKLSLHLSTVLITTRPVSSGNLLHIADRRVEILGFTQHQIREYIEKSLDGNSTHIQKLVQHLEEHPVIEGYCYLPLHVAILVHIFLTMKGALPTTLHELFCYLVLCCMVRELETHGNALPELSSLDELPKDLKSKLSDLCVVAYRGVMENKVVFYQKKLKYLHLPSNPSSLGLLQAVEGLTLLSKSLSYNFLHVSVQELLAAYHILHMDSSKQLEVFKHMIQFDSSRFQAVLRYYSGFSKLANREIQEFVSTFSSQTSNVSDLLPFLHCFFEAQDLSLCRLVRSGITGNVLFTTFQLNPVDYLAFGYLITFLLSETSSDTTNVCLRLEDEVFDYQRYKLLLLELVERSTEIFGLGWTRTLEIELNGMPIITEEAGKLIASHIEKLSPWSLMIRGCAIYKINYKIAENDERLQIGLIYQKLLESNKSLTHLTISRSRLSVIESRYIFQGLQHNNTLVHLNLSDVGLDVAARVALINMLQINKTITHLDLSENWLFYGGDCSLFEAFQQNTTLTHLNLSGTRLLVTIDIAQALATMLQFNKTLTHLDLSDNLSIGASEYDFIPVYDRLLMHQKLLYSSPMRLVNCICQGLKRNNSLRFLNLEKSGLVGNSLTAIYAAKSPTLDITPNEDYMPDS